MSTALNAGQSPRSRSTGEAAEGGRQRNDSAPNKLEKHDALDAVETHKLPPRQRHPVAYMLLVL